MRTILNNIRRATPAAFLLMIVAFSLVATRPASSGTTPQPIRIVASFYPLFEFTRQVGGGRVTVRNLVPAGIEPHDYEPTPRDVVTLTQARVVVYNGAGFEPWLQRLLPQLPGRVIRVNATEWLTEVRSGARRAPLDPHVWLDPVLAQRQVDRVLAGLARADPAGRGIYEANAAAYNGKLSALHERIARTLAPCRKRIFVVSHAAFGYFAGRYRLTQITIRGLEPAEEPSAAKVSEVVRIMRRHGVTVVYYETLVSPRVAATIAREVGARTLVLDPLEGLTGEEQRAGKDYLSIMDENLRALVQGLDCP
ncbi:MAG: metal ABC transporter substrate-binding protein [bacterium]